MEQLKIKQAEIISLWKSVCSLFDNDEKACCFHSQTNKQKKALDTIFSISLNLLLDIIRHHL